VDGTGILNGVACSNSTSCTAVGQNDVGTQGVAVPVGLGSVGTVSTQPGTLNLLAIACASAVNCIAVGQVGGELAGVIIPLSGPGAGNPLVVAGTYQFSGIACDSTTSCTVVGEDIGTGVIVPVTVGSSFIVESLVTTSTAVTSSANPSVWGRSVTLTATVTPPSGGTPTGTVTFTDTTTGATLGTAPLSASDTASVTLSTLSVGTHTIKAAYSGDANDNPSSGTVTQTVNKAATKLAAARVVKSTTPHVFSATLTRSDSGAPISGQTIVFTMKNPSTGAQNVVCTAVTASNGVAICKGSVPSNDAIFDTSYTATFAGNADYVGVAATGKYS
jgi:hypothetical protein